MGTISTCARPRHLVVVGAGLAGCEAAWQAARRGVAVRLYEMRPSHASPAHTGADLAELVCSNSLRSNELSNAVGLLKEEMRRLGSLVMAAADRSVVPAGRALAVDRALFARHVSQVIESHPRIELRRELVAKIPDDDLVVLASGPLTAPELAGELTSRLGASSLYFYDAISPIVYADSIDPAAGFRASRWQDGPGDYLNLPLDRAGYEAFVDALLGADTVPLHPFEKALYFEGCLPIEEMARRGRQTLAHGPMKPVGLVDPQGRRPHAVVQLRHEDRRGALYNLVGFQTKMRIADQQRVLRALPGLGAAVFARYGSVHRNTYVDAPRWLDATLELRGRPGLRIAGQLAGVEGYVESAALGGLAGLFAAGAALGAAVAPPPQASAHAALLRHLQEAEAGGFQPMNVNWGLFPPPADVGRREPRLDRNRRLAARALAEVDAWAAQLAPGVA